MKLIPSRTLVIDSPLSVDEARDRLASVTGPKPRLMEAWDAHRFIGEVRGDEVRMLRVTALSNHPYRPRIEGRIGPGPRGSRLIGTLRMRPAGRILATAWLVGAGLFAIAWLVGTLGAGGGMGTTLLPLGLLLAGSAIVWGPFAVEARMIRRAVTELLEAETTTESTSGDDAKRAGRDGPTRGGEENPFQPQLESEI